MATLSTLAHEGAAARYGDEPDILIRLDWELEQCGRELTEQLLEAARFHKALQGHGAVGQLRGSVASSLISYLFGLTAANPLPAHYHCTACQRVEWAGREISGIDLPKKRCVCGAMMEGDGYDLDPEFFFWNQKPWFQWRIAQEESTHNPGQQQNASTPLNQMQQLPISVRLRQYGAEHCTWKPDPWITNFLISHFQEAFVFREEIYRYLSRERNIPEREAFRYAEYVRKGMGNQVPEGVFHPGSLEARYSTAVAYLPSKAAAAEELVHQQ